MTTPLPTNTSDTARLLNGAPSFGVGWQEPVYLPNPAAGANWSYKVDGRYFERVLSVHYTLVTSAVVANRFPVLTLADQNGKIVSGAPGGSGVAASTTLITDLIIGGPAYDFANVGNSYGFLPDLLIPPGWSWQSVVGNLDVADQFSGIVLLVQRFPNDATSLSAS